MINEKKSRDRFLRDPLPRRLGGLAATLGRISSSARKSDDPIIVANLLDEASQNPKQRLLLSVQAKNLSNKAVDFSGPIETA
jgi:hypothetical protein